MTRTDFTQVAPIEGDTHLIFTARRGDYEVTVTVGRNGARRKPFTSSVSGPGGYDVGGGHAPTFEEAVALALRAIRR